MHLRIRTLWYKNEEAPRKIQQTSRDTGHNSNALTRQERLSLVLLLLSLGTENWASASRNVDAPHQLKKSEYGLEVAHPKMKMKAREQDLPSLGTEAGSYRVKPWTHCFHSATHKLESHPCITIMTMQPHKTELRTEKPCYLFYEPAAADRK